MTMGWPGRGLRLRIITPPASSWTSSSRWRMHALLKAADADRPRALLFFNVAATDDRLREGDCRGNVIHVAPTRSMLADGLAQYLVWKQWRRWLLVFGSHAQDKLYADAIRRAGKRFGARIVAEKV